MGRLIVAHFHRLIHLLKLVDEAIFQTELSQIVGIRALLIEYLADVAGLYLTIVGTHRDAAVVYPLLVDPGRKEDVEGRIYKAIGIVLEGSSHLHLFSLHLVYLMIIMLS